MLYTTIHTPAIYSNQSGEDDGLYYSFLVGVLRDAEENCLILVDENNVILQSIAQLVARWPMKYRLRAMKSVVALRKQHRFISTSASRRTSPECTYPSCKPLFQIADGSNVDMALGRQGCVDCATLPAALAVPDYTVSLSYSRLRNGRRLELADGEWSKETFEKKVWRPIFRHARYINIYDKMIGASVRRDRRTGKITVAPPRNFAAGLEWIFDQYRTHCEYKHGSIEIITGSGTRASSAEAEEKARALEKWGKQKSGAYNIPITFTVKRETSRQRMAHARFVSTDQITLLVERGFDLLRGDEYVRDVVVSVLPPQKHKQRLEAISKLPSL